MDLIPDTLFPTVHWGGDGHKTAEPTDSPSDAPSEAPSDAPSEVPSESPVAFTPIDTYAPTPCSSRLYYIITKGGKTKCSNGYDAEVISPLYFTTLDECCVELLDLDEYHGNDEVCYYMDVCGPMTYPNPNWHGDGHKATPEPTKVHTHEPTGWKETYEPTGGDSAKPKKPVD